MLVILSIISSFGYPEEGFAFMLVILSIISPLGYPGKGFVFILVILKGEMMDNITNMSTNPSSGHPKEEMMNNITKMNTNPFYGYPKEEMMDNIIISPLGYPGKGFVFILDILSIISSLGYP
jgi:hypothetical protein